MSASETLKEIHQGLKTLVGAVTMACPHCLSDLTGDEIPEEHRHNFGGTHFSRRIGVVDNDRVQYWECPDCGGQWPRTEPVTPGQFRTTHARG